MLHIKRSSISDTLMAHLIEMKELLLRWKNTLYFVFYLIELPIARSHIDRKECGRMNENLFRIKCGHLQILQ